MRALLSQTVKRLTQRFFIGDGPFKESVLLTQRRVYILPTRQGILFATVLFTMLIGSINYSNSLGFMLTFLLASLAVVCILHTYKNLLYLKISVGQIKPTYCGEPVQVPVIVDNFNYAVRRSLSLDFPGHDPTLVDIPANDWKKVEISMPSRRRGNHTIERFLLSTKYPLGLFNAWSPARFSHRYLVYPAPIGSTQLPFDRSYQPKHSGEKGHGNDDFVGFRNYHHGDSLKHINWKAVAKEQGVYTKQFGGDRSDELWLDWRTLDHLEPEARLSQLTKWALIADKTNISYGLWIPGKKINPAQGEKHRQKCLESLALFDPNSN